MNVSFKRAAKIIDISPSVMTDQHVMLNFQSLVNSGTNPEGVDNKTLIQAKEVLLSRCYEHQVREHEKFVVQCPYDEPCKRCGGTGAQFKWYKSERTKKCRCDNGKVNLGKCFACDGSGRFMKEDHGLRLNLKCKKCNGTGERIVTCKFCRGKGRKTYLVLAPKIESFTICPSCHGFGYKPPQHIYNFNSPKIVAGVTNDDPNELGNLIETLADDSIEPSEINPIDLVDEGLISLDSTEPEQSSAEAVSVPSEEQSSDHTPSDESDSPEEETSV
jgi:hypothetical protein